MKVNPFVNTEEELKREIAADAKRLSEAAHKAGVMWAGCDTADVMADKILLLRRENAEMREFIGDLLEARYRVYRVIRGDGGGAIWSIQPDYVYHKYPWLEAYLDR